MARVRRGELVGPLGGEEGAYLGGDEAANVGHVGHQIGAVLVGNASQARIVPVAGVCGGAADDQLWVEEARIPLERIIVDEARHLLSLSHGAVRCGSKVGGAALTGSTW